MNPKKHFEKPASAAALGTVLLGILIHLFGLTSTAGNYDNIAFMPQAYGVGLKSGRWMLTLLGDLMENWGFGWNLPWFNGLISFCLLGAAVYLLVELFEIRSRVLAVLLGGLFVAFPAMTSTMFFRYTTPYYCLAILFSVLAAYVVVGTKLPYAVRTLLSVVLTACSLGIYQAYLPITISIFVLFLMKKLLTEENTPWYRHVYHGIYLCVCLALGVIAYFVILNIFLKVQNMTLTGYQNISSAGKINLMELPQMVSRAIGTIFWLPEKNVFSLSPLPFLTRVYEVLGVFTLALVIFLLVQKKMKPLQTLLFLVLCGLYPLSAAFIVVMCYHSALYTIMMYGIVMIFPFPIVIYEALPREGRETLRTFFRKGLVLLLGLVLFCYFYVADLNYTAMYYSNRQAENFYSSVVTQVRMTEGFTADKRWALVGFPKDPLLKNKWQDIDALGGFGPSDRLVGAYSRIDWIENYVGYSVRYVEAEDAKKLLQTAPVQAMPCWPDQGSIQVIDDMVVVKFSDDFGEE